jgi:hypothetical protein
MLEVVGNGVDSVCLVGGLRKKLVGARIMKVEEVKQLRSQPGCTPQANSNSYSVKQC